MLFFRAQEKETEIRKTLRKRLLQLDPIGNQLLIIAVIMLLSALQCVGTNTHGQESRIVGLVVGTSLISIVFIIWQLYRGNEALIPLKEVCQRTVAASFLTSFFISGALLVKKLFYPILVSSHIERDRHQVRCSYDTIS